MLENEKLKNILLHDKNPLNNKNGLKFIDKLIENNLTKSMFLDLLYFLSIFFIWLSGSLFIYSLFIWFKVLMTLLLIISLMIWFITIVALLDLVENK